MLVSELPTELLSLVSMCSLFSSSSTRLPIFSLHFSRKSSSIDKKKFRSPKILQGTWEHVTTGPLPVLHIRMCLKGHGNEADFLGFSQKLVPHESLILPFEPFRFLLRIRGDIRIQKPLPAITDTGSRRLHVSVIRRVADSLHHRSGESPTPCITETRSRRLPASLIRGVGDSPHHRYGESAIEFFKRKFSVAMIRRVVDSPHQ
jgi:hypothetical protein